MSRSLVSRSVLRFFRYRLLLLLLFLLTLRRMLLSTEFLFALSVSFVDTGARCRLGFSRRVDAASYRTASLRAKVGTQSSEHGVVATGEHGNLQAASA